MIPNSRQLMILAAAAAGMYLAYKYGNDMVKGVATVVGAGVVVAQIPQLRAVSA